MHQSLQLDGGSGADCKQSHPNCLNLASKEGVGQQGGSSRIHAQGGGNILHPNKYHLPISFYLSTALSAGVNPCAWQGYLLALCRERQGGEAGMGMQNATLCVINITLGMLLISAQQPTCPGRGSCCAETFASWWDEGSVARG